MGFMYVYREKYDKGNGMWKKVAEGLVIQRNILEEEQLDPKTWG